MRWLPLLLIAALVVLGSLVEAVRFHTLLWGSKVPIVLLLAWAIARAVSVRRPHERGSSS